MYSKIIQLFYIYIYVLYVIIRFEHSSLCYTVGPCCLSILCTVLYISIFCIAVVVQSLRNVQFFATLCTAACQTSLTFTISWSLPKLMSIESVMPSNHLILCHPCLLLPSIFPTIRDFSNESALLIKWPKHWNFSFSSGPSNEYSGLISFRMDWFDFSRVFCNTTV